MALAWIGQQPRFREGQTTSEMLSMGMSGDLAYTVWIDRGQVRVAGRDAFSPMALRVTNLFRREEDAWKIIHQHVDPIMVKTETSAILQEQGLREE